LTRPSGDQEEQGTLYFFRRRPAHGSALISSLQSIETTFFLIALRRHPHALTTLVSGIESALQVADIGSKKGDNVQDLIQKARAKSPRLRQLSDIELDQLRLARNRFTHRGFSPKDDSEAVGLLLQIAVPLADAAYSDLHDFDFRHALLDEYTHLLDVAVSVCTRARSANVSDVSYSLNAFGHLIRWKFQENFSAGWQLKALNDADEFGAHYDHVAKEIGELERLFSAPCVLDCPICDGIKNGVCELDEDALDSGQLIPRRFACTNCGFVVHKGEAFLSEVLLARQLDESRQAILDEYGVS